VNYWPWAISGQDGANCVMVAAADGVHEIGGCTDRGDQVSHE